MKYTKPKPKRISKILDPIALVIAMSHFHFLATMIDDIRSGIDVQAARIVSPMTALGTWSINASSTADITIRCARRAIIIILTVNVHRNLCFPLFGFGMIYLSHWIVMWFIENFLVFFFTISMASLASSSCVRVGATYLSHFHRLLTIKI